MAKQPAKKKKPRVHKDLQGFEVSVNQFGELNASTLRRRIAAAPLFGRVGAASGGKPARAVRAVYLEILCRYPAQEELDTVLAHAEESGLTRRQALEDLVWALVNTKEFLYRH